MKVPVLPKEVVEPKFNKLEQVIYSMLLEKDDAKEHLLLSNGDKNINKED